MAPSFPKLWTLPWCSPVWDGGIQNATPLNAPSRSRAICDPLNHLNFVALEWQKSASLIRILSAKCVLQ